MFRQGACWEVDGGGVTGSPKATFLVWTNWGWLRSPRGAQGEHTNVLVPVPSGLQCKPSEHAHLPSKVHLGLLNYTRM